MKPARSNQEGTEWRNQMMKERGRQQRVGWSEDAAGRREREAVIAVYFSFYSERRQKQRLTKVERERACNTLLFLQ